MTTPVVVSNSSPIIALNQISHLFLLERLFASVVIPPAVLGELKSVAVLPSWIIQQPLAHSISPPIRLAGLDPGETEAISLALEVGAQWVILDDYQARRLAQQQGLQIIGTLGILLAAKRQGILPAIRTQLDSLVQFGFHVSPSLYGQILADAGEAPDQQV